MKKIKLTETELTNVIKRVINEGQLNEYFGGAEGQVTIRIEGEGEIKDFVVNKIRRMVNGMGGDIRMVVDDEDM